MVRVATGIAFFCNVEGFDFTLYCEDCSIL